MWNWRAEMMICSILARSWKMLLLCSFSISLDEMEACIGLINWRIVSDRFLLH